MYIRENTKLRESNYPSEFMKHLFFFFGLFWIHFSASSQGNLPETFFEGKSIVMVSNDPGARPAMTWQQLSDSVHMALVKAGADPVAYFELEQVTLSEEIQADYAKAFLQREVKNIVFVTRKKSEVSIHVGAFSGDGKMINSTALFGVSGIDVPTASELFAGLGTGRKFKNLLVIDVAEFPRISTQEAVSSLRFLPRNPLNLEIFKLGIPIEGSSAQSGFLSYFRYDLYGKSQEAILAEQVAQKSGIQQILEQEYPYQTEWLTEAKPDAELISNKIQFVLMKVEGREADLMKSLGLDPTGLADPSRIVVKYYIKFLVRDELYIGPFWDANPDWRKALRDFLQNQKNKPPVGGLINS